MSDWGLRARQVVSGQFAVVVVGLVLLAAVGGWVAYETHIDPGTHVEQRQTSSWSTTANFTHEATVTERNPVYPIGTTLSNRTAYFGSIAPILNGSLQYRYAASDSGNLSVSSDSWLTFQRVERGRDGTIEAVYWRTTRDIEQGRLTDVPPGELAHVPFSVNVSDLANRSEQIEEELGRTSGETEAIVRVDVSVNGTVNGDRISRTDQYTLPVAVGEVYRVQDSGPTNEEFTTTQPITVENAYGPLRTAGGPLLLAGALLGLAGVFVARSRDRVALSSDERAYLSYRDDRSDFDEWINTISLPEGVGELPSAEAASLADLVDFAIDTDNSVIEDPDNGTYHVIHDGYRYTYTPPTKPIRNAGPHREPNENETVEASEATDPLDDPAATDD